MRSRSGGPASSQPQLGVDQSRRTLCLFFVDDDRDFNLRGGYELNIDAISPQALEQSRRDTRMRAHSNSHDAELGYAACGVQARSAKLAYNRHQNLPGVFEFILVNRE